MLYKQKTDLFRSTTTDATDERPLEGTSWKGAPKHVLKGTASLLGKSYWNQSRRKRRALMIVDVHLKVGDGTGEVAPVCAQILSRNACTRPESKDLIYSGRVTCWHDQSSSGAKLVTKGWHDHKIISTTRNIADTCFCWSVFGPQILPIYWM